MLWKFCNLKTVHEVVPTRRHSALVLEYASGDQDVELVVITCDISFCYISGPCVLLQYDTCPNSR